MRLRQVCWHTIRFDRGCSHPVEAARIVRARIQHPAIGIVLLPTSTFVFHNVLLGPFIFHARLAGCFTFGTTMQKPDQSLRSIFDAVISMASDVTLLPAPCTNTNAPLIRSFTRRCTGLKPFHWTDRRRATRKPTYRRLRAPRSPPDKRATRKKIQKKRPQELGRFVVVRANSLGGQGQGHDAETVQLAHSRGAKADDQYLLIGVKQT
jgi:hypothetical protein